MRQSGHLDFYWDGNIVETQEIAAANRAQLLLGGEEDKEVEILFENVYIDFDNIYLQAIVTEPKQREAQGRALSPLLPKLAPDDGAEAKMARTSSKIKYFKVQLNRESTGLERAKLLKDFREEDWKQLLQNVVKEHV